MTRATHDYAPFYCEENVLRLLPALGPEAFAVLVTNARRCIAMRHQRTGGPGTGAVVWDYHAFALSRRGEWMAWDLDSTLPWPASAGEYLRRSFVAEAEDAPLFRVVAGGDYLREFRSDRSHMRRADGTWTAPPPAWPAPDGAAGVRLADLLHPGSRRLGELLSLEAMRERWRG